MQFRGLAYFEALCLLLAILGSILGGNDARGQAPLTINYTNLQMSSGAYQNLSASGGSPPYNWVLSGGGSLTPSGGDNTSAGYVAPASNPNCTDNPMIILTDGYRNIVDVQIAVNCYIGNNVAYRQFSAEYEYSWCAYVCNMAGLGCIYSPFWSEYSCDGTFQRETGYGGPPPFLSWPYKVCIEVFAGCPSPCSQFPGDFRQNVEPCSEQTIPWSCGDIVDVRGSLKNAGCCPINPLTGLPFDNGTSDSEGESENTGPPNKDKCVDQSVANPVNVATGNKYEEVVDLKVSTPGIPLEFRRSYNSKVIFDSPLGYGWTHSYDLSLGVLQTSPTTRIRIWDSDGRALYFYQVQQNSSEIIFGGESGVKDRLKQVISTGEYFLRRKRDNLTYKFGSDGKLLLISDPNGNTQTMTYTGGLLTQVSDNFGKSLSIQYSNNRISSVTDPKNQSVSYQIKTETSGR